jgi:hypothetical protein
MEAIVVHVEAALLAPEILVDGSLALLGAGGPIDGEVPAQGGGMFGEEEFVFVKQAVEIGLDVVEAATVEARRKVARRLGLSEVVGSDADFFGIRDFFRKIWKSGADGIVELGTPAKSNNGFRCE